MKTMSILKLVTPLTYFPKIDLKDAYYTIQVSPSHQKYLKFANNQDLYKFTCLPNGYCYGTRKFTKVSKPPLSTLRLDNITIAAYLDDCINMNPSLNQCFENTKKIIKLFQTLRFNVHSEPKSNFTPIQRIEFLRFVIDSVTMTITLNNNKKQKLKILCANLLSGVTTIRTISQVLGKITSSFPATKFGRLHYRNLEVFKTRALKYHKNNFNAKVCLSEEAKGDLRWWKNNIDEIYNDIIVPNPSIEIKTDASLNGWGAVMGSSSTGGLFSDEETQNHINVLELKAILFGLESLARHNSTAFSTSHSGKRDTLKKQTWKWAEKNENWLSATDIPGIQNTEADLASRKNEVHTEWKLRENIFSNICSQLNTSPKTDLFATSVNTPLSTVISYRPDSKCIAVDAFRLDWSKLDFYAFPPFVCLNRVLQKIYQDKAKGIVIAPDWPSQPFYPRLIAMSIKTISIALRETNLYLPNQPAVKHSLRKALKILACLVNGTKII